MALPEKDMQVASSSAITLASWFTLRTAKQIYTAQEYAGRAVQAIDRRVCAARRKEILAGN